jgi:hypothetical protein
VERDVVRDLAACGVDGSTPPSSTRTPIVAALVLDVLVAVEEAVGGLEAHDATERDVLTELAGELRDVLADGAALVGGSASRRRLARTELRELATAA